MSTSDRDPLTVLALDPDSDFLAALEGHLSSDEDLRLVTLPYSRNEPLAIEEAVLEHYPDIVVLNLDQQDGPDFGKPISEILSIPLAMPPILLATTTRDESGLKQLAYRLGVWDYLVRPFTLVDLGLKLEVLAKIRRLKKQLEAATRKLSTANLQLADFNRKLEEMTITDELTGLSNMRFMTQFLEKQFQLLSRYERPFSIMMIDLDHFKSVNDTNDHLVGSSTIRAVGRIIDLGTRTSDVKARYGGDEYIVAMPETDLPGAELVANRLRESIEAAKHKGHDDKEFSVTASIGVASFGKGRHASYRELVKEADRAMYLAKHWGRNRVVPATPENLGSELKDYDESQSAVLGEIRKIDKKG